jgi:hypothetical protein
VTEFQRFGLDVLDFLESKDGVATFFEESKTLSTKEWNEIQRTIGCSDLSALWPIFMRGGVCLLSPRVFVNKLCRLRCIAVNMPCVCAFEPAKFWLFCLVKKITECKRQAANEI